MKFSSIRLKAILPIIGVVLFASCKKEEALTHVDDTTASERNYTLSMPSSSIPSEIEDLGILHNEVMDHMASQTGFAEFTFSESLYEASTYFENNLPGYEEEISTISGIDPDMELTLVEVFEDYGYSLDAVTLAQELEGYLYSAYTTETSANDLLQTLVDLEEDVMNAGLSGQEEEGLLGATCIARYSTLYWDQAEEDTENPWYEGIQDDDDRMTNPGFASEMVTIATDRGEETTTVPMISIRTWIDVHAYVKTYVHLTDAGWGSEDAAWHAGAAASAWSGWMQFMP